MYSGRSSTYIEYVTITIVDSAPKNFNSINENIRKMGRICWWFGF